MTAANLLSRPWNLARLRSMFKAYSTHGVAGGRRGRVPARGDRYGTIHVPRLGHTRVCSTISGIPTSTPDSEQQKPKRHSQIEIQDAVMTGEDVDSIRSLKRRDMQARQREEDEKNTRLQS